MPCLEGEEYCYDAEPVANIAIAFTEAVAGGVTENNVQDTGANTQIIEYRLPIYDTNFEVKLDGVKKVTLVPEDVEVPLEYKNGICKFVIDKFACKQVVSIGAE